MNMRRHYIGGQWRTARDGIDVVNPSDGQVMARIARGTTADVDAAVTAALDEGWGKLADPTCANDIFIGLDGSLSTLEHAPSPTKQPRRGNARPPGHNRHR